MELYNILRKAELIAIIIYALFVFIQREKKFGIIMRMICGIILIAINMALIVMDINPNYTFKEEIWIISTGIIIIMEAMYSLYGKK